MSAYKIWILILCSVIFIGGCRSEEILLESGEAPVEAAEGEESEITEETSEDLIYVYVCGRVKALCRAASSAFWWRLSSVRINGFSHSHPCAAAYARIRSRNFF